MKKLLMKLTVNVNSKVVYSKVVSLTDCIELASHLLVVGLRFVFVYDGRKKMNASHRMRAHGTDRREKFSSRPPAKEVMLEGTFSSLIALQPMCVDVCGSCCVYVSMFYRICLCVEYFGRIF